MRSFYIVLLFLFCNENFSRCNPFSSVVETTTGKLRGQLIDVPGSGSKVYEFSSIPFAEPPVGPNRFRKTVPKVPWSGVLEATTLPSMCHQGPMTDAMALFMQDVEMSEDCLYLNVWVSQKAFEEKQSLPVFFWIHGGSFTEGSTASTKLNGTMLSAFENVVFVSVQYRLGILGFSYLGTEGVPGNMAIWDQLEGLKWTFENIAAFGGDPDRITVTGQSAGGASVSILLLSPLAKPYIHQAIVQSGTVTSSWGSVMPDQALARTNKVFPYLARNYPDQCANVTAGSSLEDRENCLRNSGAEYKSKLQVAMVEIDKRELTPGVIDSISLQPVVDGKLLPRNPVQMIAEGDFAKVPLLTGLVKDEGTFFMKVAPIGLTLLPTHEHPNRTFDDFDMDTYKKFIKSYFVYYPINGNKIDPVVRRAIETQYWRTPDNELSQPLLSGDIVFDRVISMIGDVNFYCPVISLADAYGKFVKGYQFFFAHRTEDNPVDLEWMGVKHSADLQYTLGDGLQENLKRINYTEKEKLLCRRTMQYLGNFVKTGDPNQVDSTLPDRVFLPEWPSYTSSAKVTLILDRDGTKGELIHSLKRRDCEFWNTHLPKMDARLNGLYEPGITTTPCPPPLYIHSASFRVSLYLMFFMLSIVFTLC